MSEVYIAARNIDDTFNRKVRSWDQLQDMLRGESNIANDLATLIECQKTTELSLPSDELILTYRGRSGKYNVSASVRYFEGNRLGLVNISSSRRTLPLIGYKERSFVQFSDDGTWDGAASHDGESYMPFTCSPKYTDFYSSKGDTPVYTNDSALPTTTMRLIGEKGSADAERVCTGFYQVASLQIDRLMESIESR